MCLTYSKRKTFWLKLRARLTFRRKIKCYKMLNIGGNGDIFTPFRGTLVLSNVFSSDRPHAMLTDEELLRRRISYGIHVFTTKRMAKYNAKLWDDRGGTRCKYVKCYGRVKDLVAKGDDQAVFTEITIPQKELDRIRNG